MSKPRLKIQAPYKMTLASGELLAIRSALKHYIMTKTVAEPLTPNKSAEQDYVQSLFDEIDAKV